jgi:hypothetical protein
VYLTRCPANHALGLLITARNGDALRVVIRTVESELPRLARLEFHDLARAFHAKIEPYSRAEWLPGVPPTMRVDVSRDTWIRLLHRDGDELRLCASSRAYEFPDALTFVIDEPGRAFEFRSARQQTYSRKSVRRGALACSP